MAKTKKIVESEMEATAEKAVAEQALVEQTPEVTEQKPKATITIKKDCAELYKSDANANVAVKEAGALLQGVRANFEELGIAAKSFTVEVKAAVDDKTKKPMTYKNGTKVCNVSAILALENNSKTADGVTNTEYLKINFSKGNKDPQNPQLKISKVSGFIYSEDHSTHKKTPDNVADKDILKSDKLSDEIKLAFSAIREPELTKVQQELKAVGIESTLRPNFIGYNDKKVDGQLKIIDTADAKKPIEDRVYNEVNLKVFIDKEGAIRPSVSTAYLGKKIPKTPEGNLPEGVKREYEEYSTKDIRVPSQLDTDMAQCSDALKLAVLIHKSHEPNFPDWTNGTAALREELTKTVKETANERATAMKEAENYVGEYIKEDKAATVADGLADVDTGINLEEELDFSDGISF